MEPREGTKKCSNKNRVTARRTRIKKTKGEIRMPSMETETNALDSRAILKLLPNWSCWLFTCCMFSLFYHEWFFLDFHSRRYHDKEYFLLCMSLMPSLPQPRPIALQPGCFSIEIVSFFGHASFLSKSTNCRLFG